jgi:uncharacterized protein YbcC (UPF0753/DUF2309 family)
MLWRIHAAVPIHSEILPAGTMTATRGVAEQILSEMKHGVTIQAIRSEEDLIHLAIRLIVMIPETLSEEERTHLATRSIEMIVAIEFVVGLIRSATLHADKSA